MPQARLVSSSFLRLLLFVVVALLVTVVGFTTFLAPLSRTHVPVVALRAQQQDPNELGDVRSTHYQQQQLLLQLDTTVTPNRLRRHKDNEWHVKPLKPHHTGHVTYVTEISSDRNHLIYKRIFNAPCGYGMLVFNVGPAALYEPYTYELYEDAYAYSNNDGLCVLYPSYNGVQEATVPLWSFTDELEMTVPLGDTPTQISTRIVIPPNTKHINTTDPNKYHGGDYLIIREGNFYNPTYYKNLKELINHWPPTVSQEEISDRFMELVAVL